MADLSPILTVAYDILNDTKKPMHVDEIAIEAARTNRNLQLSEEEFARKVSSALSANVKSKSPSFAKVANKTGGLKRGVYKAKTRRVQAAPRPEPEPIEPVGNSFLGKAGEFAVMAELLYRGFNASLMAVDEGVDIVASKNNEYFHIQVKTSALGANGKCAFFIKNSAFDANSGGKTYYIFVMRAQDGRNVFAVLPGTQLRIHRDAGSIGGANGISITVTPDPKFKTFLMNRNHNIDQFINNFGLIK
jgi:hypothetical protein